MLEWELAERQKHLISVELFNRVAMAAFAPVREFAERQIRAHGNGTADDWRETIERFTRAIESVTGQSIDSNGTGEPDRTAELAAPAASAVVGRVDGSQNPPPDGAVCGPAVSSQSPPGKPPVV